MCGDVAISCFKVNQCTAFRNIVLEIPTGATLPRNDKLDSATHITTTTINLTIRKKRDEKCPGKIKKPIDKCSSMV